MMPQVDKTVLDALLAPGADLEEAYRRLPIRQRMPAAQALEVLAERAAVAAAYVEDRALGSTPESAGRGSESRRRRVRRAMGYSNP